VLTKKNRKKSRQQLEIENEIFRKGQNANSIALALGSLFKWGGLVGITYFSFRSIEVLAGNSTDAKILVGIIASVENKDLGLVLLNGLFCLLFFRERNLRKKKGDRVGARIRELEELLDPKRSSSKLHEGARKE